MPRLVWNALCSRSHENACCWDGRDINNAFISAEKKKNAFLRGLVISQCFQWLMIPQTANRKTKFFCIQSVWHNSCLKGIVIIQASRLLHSVELHQYPLILMPENVPSEPLRLQPPRAVNPLSFVAPVFGLNQCATPNFF